MPRSEVWLAFELRGKRVQCKWCSTAYAHSGSTTMMKNHIEAKHLTRFKHLVKPNPRTQICATDDKHSIEMIATSFSLSNIPFTFIENEKFRSFLRSRDPLFPLISADTLKNHVSRRGDDYIERVRSVLKNKKDLGIELDGWKYENANCHLYSTLVTFIDDNYERQQLLIGVRQIFGKCDAPAIGRAVAEMLEMVDLSLLDVSTSVSDAGSNIVAFLKRNDILQCHCGSHVLSLVLNKVLNNAVLAGCLKKARGLAGLLKSSTETCENFKKNAADLKITHQLPKNFSITRWGGAFILLKSWSVHMRTIILDSTLQDYVPTSAEKETLKNCVEVLEPVHELLLKFERRSSYVSELLPELCALYRKISRSAAANSPVATKTLEALKERIVKAESNELTVLSVLSDPRFAFIDGLIGSLAWSPIIEKFADFAKKRQPIGTTPSSPASSPRADTTCESAMESFLSDTTMATNNKSKSIEDELTLFRAELTVTRPVYTSDPLEYWRNKAESYPILSDIARVFLTCRASSSQTERLFSKCTDIASNLKRNRVSPGTLNSTLLCAALEVFESDDEFDSGEGYVGDTDEDEEEKKTVETQCSILTSDAETQWEEIKIVNSD